MVNIPVVEEKRFRGIAKAMGWNIQPARRKKRLYDPETGQYFNDETVKTVEEARKGIGLQSYASFDEFLRTCFNH